ncbi:SDR family oxidoreductase [Clostridiaceae bacterium M8S5]|nr:SDR family oxidoreductase [Clostridiaceae bacterium M8S5]
MKKLVVITGASSGFGRETAIKLSKMGHPLLLLARRIEKMKELNLPNTLCKKVDVTDIKAMKEAIAEAEELYGKVDCLINNAGIMLLGNMNEQDPNEWNKMFDVNVKGLLNGIHIVLDDMIKREEGSIINISSIAGKKSFTNHVAYCGTKFAVHAMSETLREEVAKHNVRVMVIAPGAADTELLSHTTFDTIKSDYKEWTESIGGSMSAKDVANAIVYAYSQPQHVCIREIVLAKTRQEP